MKYVELKEGDDCWLFLSYHRGEMSKGKVIKVIQLEGYTPLDHYVIEIPTSVDNSLEIRDGFTVSDSPDKPLGWMRREIVK
jgi:hypothetical protein